MGALDIADVAFGGVGRQAEDKRQSRQQQAQRNDATFDRYFHKKTIDDYFRKSSDEKTEEDKEELRERRKLSAITIIYDVYIYAYNVLYIYTYIYTYSP